MCNGDSGHIEVAQVKYNPQMCDFKSLVRFFFTFHDPTTYQRQGPDDGEQYTSVIFYHNEEQKKESLRAIEELNTLLKDNKIDFLPRRDFEGDKVRWSRS